MARRQHFPPHAAPDGRMRRAYLPAPPPRAAAKPNPWRERTFTLYALRFTLACSFDFVQVLAPLQAAMGDEHPAHVAPLADVRALLEAALAAAFGEQAAAEALAAAPDMPGVAGVVDLLAQRLAELGLGLGAGGSEVQVWPGRGQEEAIAGGGRRAPAAGLYVANCCDGGGGGVWARQLVCIRSGHCMHAHALCTHAHACKQPRTQSFPKRRTSCWPRPGTGRSQTSMRHRAKTSRNRVAGPGGGGGGCMWRTW